MNTITKKFIVTRDIPSGSSGSWIRRWPIKAELKKIEGRWHSSNEARKIDEMTIYEFKKYFGFTPRKGSKRITSMTIRYR